MSGVTLAGSQSLSTLTGSNIIAKVRENLNELVADFWNDVGLMYWMNEGIQDIVTKTLCNGTSEEVTLAAETLEYPLLNTYTTVIAATYNNAKGLIRSDPRSIGNVNPVGEPVYFYEWDGSISLFPILAAGSAAIGKLVKVLQVSFPSEIVETDTVPLPNHFIVPLIHYVTAQAHYKEGTPVEDSRGDRRLSNYFASIKAYRQDFGDKGRDEASEIGDA